MHQGTVLGPLLFLVLIKLMIFKTVFSPRLGSSQITALVYRRIKNQTDCSILQHDLNSLAEWEKKWGMAFRPENCRAIRMTRSRNPFFSNYSLKGQMPWCRVQSNMSWKRHMNQTVKNKTKQKNPRILTMQP